MARTRKILKRQQTVSRIGATASSQEKTKHTIFIADSRRMLEVADSSVHLVVTSPPYYNAPYDYKDYFASYEAFLSLMQDSAQEMKRILQDGRMACINCDDMLVDGEKYPIVADVTKIFMENGFKYREHIIWKKPMGYVRISRRSGVLIQNPYPMYFYPDNITESILIFQKKGEEEKRGNHFNHQSIDSKIRRLSQLDARGEYLRENWYVNVWDMTNVLPLNRIEKDVAAFPDELPYRLIKMLSFVGETVLDPFLGSGTTSKVAKELGRNSIGYEIDEKLIPVIQAKIAQRLRLKKKYPKLLEPEMLLESEKASEYELEIIKRKEVENPVTK
jgi:site-specific DNA-methyltransferase (adenine-specific)